jgi:hypothetical protein
MLPSGIKYYHKRLKTGTVCYLQAQSTNTVTKRTNLLNKSRHLRSKKTTSVPNCISVTYHLSSTWGFNHIYFPKTYKPIIVQQLYCQVTKERSTTTAITCDTNTDRSTFTCQGNVRSEHVWRTDVNRAISLAPCNNQQATYTAISHSSQACWQTTRSHRWDNARVVLKYPAANGAGATCVGHGVPTELREFIRSNKTTNRLI